MQILLNPRSIDDYELFLKIKRLPTWSIRGRVATFPDEYAATLGLAAEGRDGYDWTSAADLFDYQRDIAAMAIRKRKYCVFADCGLGKTLIMLEQAMAAEADTGRGVLIVSPKMVVDQTIDEAARFYPRLSIEAIEAKSLRKWLKKPRGVAITNYEAIKDDLPQGTLGGLSLDESSMLKSHYGKWGTRLLELGRGVPYKFCGTGTPAPNDRIEYANHAVFMDAFPTVNSFLATYFVNKGQTQERWVLKPHALAGFYRALSHWCIFLVNPSTYGWEDNTKAIPPIHVHIDDVPLTDEQKALFQKLTGQLFANHTGGIGNRSRLAQIAKGNWQGKPVATHKPRVIQELIDSWPDESAIIWCLYNKEQDGIANLFPDAANISGDTPHEERLELIADFKAGRRRVMITKPKILGFGLNLQIATRQVFSGLQDSYEQFYQAVKRSNRIGSTKPLNVHIPVTDIEQPMIQTVLNKARRVERDTEEQERIFKEYRYAY